MKVIALLRLLSVYSIATASEASVFELSRRSGMAVPELKELLAECDKYQLNMTMCAFHDFVVSDLEIEDVLRAADGRLRKDCSSKVRASKAPGNLGATERAVARLMRRPGVVGQCGLCCTACVARG